MFFFVCFFFFLGGGGWRVMLLSCFLLLFLLLVCLFEVVCMSSKDAGSDPEAFWLRPVMPITASVQPESDRIVYIGFRLPASSSVPFLQSEPGSYCAKPVRIRSGWPGQVLAKRICPGSKPVCKNHRARFYCGPLPVSIFQTRLHPFTDAPDRNIVQHQPWQQSG